MTTAADLCERGFLPRELPPPFSSSSFGALVRTGWTPTIPHSSKPYTHNLFRWGSLRRQLSIPNPLAFVGLARELEAHWPSCQPLFTLSPWSLSRPDPSTTRALVPARDHRVLLLARAAQRAGQRYVLRADIGRFYYSIYTHTLEWAVHGKSAVKYNRALPKRKQLALWGRGLDDRHRDLQDRQSVGIPVGPDTSLVAAEILLGRVDSELHQKSSMRGIRYVDDYEFYFTTLADAERALAALQESLAEYELALNPAKTGISELPTPLEPSWARTLRRLNIRAKGSGQRLDIVDLFDASFELLNTHRESHVLRFALGVTRNSTCLPSNWPVLQSLYLQTIMVESGVIREVLSELIKYEQLGRSLDRTRIAETLAAIIIRHAPLGHGSEVCWALWAHVQLNIPVDETELAAVELMSDCAAALVTLDAYQRGLTPRPPASSVWNSMMTAAELTDSGWLLAYEAGTKRWLSGAHIAVNRDFDDMKKAGVEFYQVLPQASPAPINLGTPGGGGGGPY